MMNRAILRPFDRRRPELVEGLRTPQSSAQGTILLVEDDVSTAVPLVIGLQDQGFRALHASDGQRGLEFARAARPDLVLLDVMLPQMDGFTVCRTLRRESAVPIIMLAAGGQERDRVKGLEIGADDYLVQPFSFRELLARARALLRRRELDRGNGSPPRDRIVVGDPSTGSGQAIVLDRAAHQVWRAGRLMDMPPREFDLLCVLMENAGTAVPHQELLDQVWGEDWIGYARTLDVHIYRLRKKLEDDPSAPCYIQTVHGYGHRFVDTALRQACPERSLSRAQSRGRRAQILP